MTVDEFERQTYHTVQKFSFIKAVATVDKTTNTIKLRLHIASDCFVQVYANTLKGLLSYALILNRSRLYGRDCEGGMWHRHPYDHSDDHDFGPTPCVNRERPSCDHWPKLRLLHQLDEHAVGRLGVQESHPAKGPLTRLPVN